MRIALSYLESVRRKLRDVRFNDPCVFPDAESRSLCRSAGASGFRCQDLPSRAQGCTRKWFNEKHGHVGHLWQERPFSCVLSEAHANAMRSGHTLLRTEGINFRRTITVPRRENLAISRRRLATIKVQRRAFSCVQPGSFLRCSCRLLAFRLLARTEHLHRTPGTVHSEKVANPGVDRARQRSIHRWMALVSAGSSKRSGSPKQWARTGSG